MAKHNIRHLTSCSHLKYSCCLENRLKNVSTNSCNFLIYVGKRTELIAKQSMRYIAFSRLMPIACKENYFIAI